MTEPSEFMTAGVQTKEDQDAVFQFQSRFDLGIAWHPGWNSVKKFVARFAEAPVGIEKMRTLMASLVSIYAEVPGGILALALRTTDYWMQTDRWGAVRKGAAILFSGVDEFGLHDLRNGVGTNHHEMMRDFLKRLRLHPEDVVEEFALPRSVAFAKVVADYYRVRPLMECLGSHIVSETTAAVEFAGLYKGFLTFPSEYGFAGADDRGLDFYKIHVDVEGSHGVSAYAAVLPFIRDRGEQAVVKATYRGAVAYMDAYEAAWDELYGSIYGEG